MYAAIDNGTILAVCHDVKTAWHELTHQSGSYRDACEEYETLANDAMLYSSPDVRVGRETLLDVMRDVILRQRGVGVTRAVQDADGTWRATNY